MNGSAERSQAFFCAGFMEPHTCVCFAPRTGGLDVDEVIG